MAIAGVQGNRIGKRVQEARIKRELSQVELSAILEVDYHIVLSDGVIGHIENGRRTVRDKEIHALCKALGVSPNWLFEW